MHFADESRTNCHRCHPVDKLEKLEDDGSLAEVFKDLKFAEFARFLRRTNESEEMGSNPNDWNGFSAALNRRVLVSNPNLSINRCKRKFFFPRNSHEIKTFRRPPNLQLTLPPTFRLLPLMLSLLTLILSSAGFASFRRIQTLSSNCRLPRSSNDFELLLSV